MSEQIAGREHTPLFAEVIMPEEVTGLVQARALELGNGVYVDNFQARGDFIEQAQAVQTELLKSAKLADQMERLKDGSLVYLKVTGLPRDPTLPAPPIDGDKPVGKETFVSEGVAVGLGLMIGYPSLILGEKHEALVHQITPVPGREQTQSNEGEVYLRFHQDLAPNPALPTMPYSDAMPDWLILTGLQKGSGETRTFVASIDRAAGRLTAETKDVLSQDRFVTDPPDSFKKEHPEITSKLPVHAVLKERDGRIEAAFDVSSNLRPVNGDGDSEALDALDELEQALDAVKQEVVIEPGTSVIFNNRRVVHGRTSVAKELDAAKRRWIQRLYIFDIERLVGEAMGYPTRTIQVGGGVIRIARAFEGLDPRMAELV